MPVHICRDFHTDYNQPDTNLYLTAIFLHTVLSYSVVGNTNFNLTGSFRTTTGTSASINFGGSNTFAVQIPTSTYTVTTSDHGKLLALRSTLYPRYNSGIFRVLSSSVVNNYLYIDYVAATGSNPPPETNTLNFGLFLSESNFTPTLTTNGGTGYLANGVAATSRIILQSPHSSAWQVRLCAETSDTIFRATTIPGFSGSSTGDFPVGSYDLNNTVEHLHTGIWFNQQSSVFNGSVPGLNFLQTDIVSRNRVYIWGDDQTGDFVLANRQVSSSYMDGWASFGLASGTAIFDYSKLRTAHKLYALGCGNITSTQKNISWDFGPDCTTTSASIGVAFGTNMRPVSCTAAMYCYLGGHSYTITPLHKDTNATDNVFLNSTELQPVELIAGTYTSTTSHNGINSTTIFDFDPRRMGFMPLAKVGRSNIGDFTLTTDSNSSSIHLKNGVYLPWEGPPLRP